MINQTAEHITQAGTTQLVDVQAKDINVTPAQYYSLLFCLTIITITFIICTTKLLQTLILKLTRKDLKILKQEILAEIKQ